GPAARPDQPEDHAQRGRLPGAVRPQKAVHLTAPHGEAHPVDGEVLPVLLRQLSGGNGHLPATAHISCLTHTTSVAGDPTRGRPPQEDTRPTPPGVHRPPTFPSSQRVSGPPHRVPPAPATARCAGGAAW